MRLCARRVSISLKRFRTPIRTVTLTKRGSRASGITQDSRLPDVRRSGCAFRRNRLRVWFVALCAAGWVCVSPAAAQSPASQPARLGAFQTQIGGFSEPTAAALAHDGSIWVVERGAHRVRVVDATGRELRTVGGFGTADGLLRAPEGIALSPGGEVFVADTGNHRVQVFSADGRFVRGWGRYGAGDGEFDGPRAVSADADRVAVCDTGNARVQVFSYDGRLLSTVDGRAALAPLSAPTAASLTPDGDVCVVDAGETQMRRFAADGTMRWRVGQWGSFAGLMAAPLGICSYDSLIFVADTRNHRVQVFGSDGAPLYSFGLHAIRPREGNGKLHYPDHVAVSRDGQLAVVCESSEDRIQLFRRGPIEPSLGPPPSIEQGGAAHFGPNVDCDGPLLVLTEPDSQRVLIYTAQTDPPILLTTIGAYGARPGQFVHPTDVHLDFERRSLLVINAGARRIDEFRLRYDPKAELGFDPAMAEFVRGVEFASLSDLLPSQNRTARFRPVAIERDASGAVLLLDAGNRCLATFSADFSALVRVYAPRVGDAPLLDRPTDVAIAPGSRLLVADELARRVFVLDAHSGAVLQTLGDGGATTLDRPACVAVADNGEICVTDSGRHALVRFAADGAILGTYGRRGLGALEFQRPMGLARDARGRWIVLDYGNHRAQILTADGEFVTAFGARLYVLPTRTRTP